MLVTEIEDEEEMWYQQDGVSPHTAQETINLLKVIFPNKPISKKGNIY